MININYTIDISTDGTYSVNEGDVFLYETNSLEDAKRFIAERIMKVR